MRRLLLVLASALAITGLAAGCNKVPAGETPAQKAEKALFAQMDTMGYLDIKVTTEIEDEGSKASPKPSPTPSTAKTPNRIITATPRSTGGKPSPSPTPPKSAATKKITVISAVGMVPGTLCWANIEQKLGSQAPEFDEVIVHHDGTLDPDGIDVEGDARKDITPDGVRTYMRANHPECFAS